MLEVDDIVLCVVEKVVGANVFVKIQGNGEGNLILSEVSAGRIRNLRKYIFPNKRIICKVIRISKDRVDLSLRRVTNKEKEEFKENYKEEKKIKSLLKNALGDKSKEIIESITKKEPILDFFERVKKNQGELEGLIGKEKANEILKILNSQKKKKRTLKKEFSLKTTKPNGVLLIKEVLSDLKEFKIRYISAGRYSIKIESENIKEADHLLNKALEKIKQESKKRGMSFEIIGK